MPRLSFPPSPHTSAFRLPWLRQVNSIIDICNPTCLEWFHGGLDLHSVHHLYPRMCREHYRLAHPQIVSMCKAHGVELEVMPWTSAVAKVLRKLRSVSAFDATVDPPTPSEATGGISVLKTAPTPIAWG